MEPREEVKKFAQEMEKQLQANEHKGGWKKCNDYLLYKGIEHNARELVQTLMMAEGNKADIIRRCANIANYAMMIADNFGGLGGKEQ